MFILKNRFMRSLFNSCVYLTNTKRDVAIYFLVYIYASLIACKNIEEIKKLKLLLSGEFEMKDLWAAKKILRM